MTHDIVFLDKIMQTLDKDHKYFHLTLLVSIVATFACSIVMFVNHKLYLLEGVSENQTFALMIATLLIISSLYFLRKIVFCSGGLGLTVKKTNRFELDNKSLAIAALKLFWKQVVLFTIFIASCTFCVLNFVSHNILLGTLFLLIMSTSIPFFISLLYADYSIKFKKNIVRVFYVNHPAYFKYIDYYINDLSHINNNDPNAYYDWLIHYDLKYQLYYCLHQAVISKHTSFKHIAALSNIIEDYMNAHVSYDLIRASELQIIEKFHDEFNQIKDDNNFKNLGSTHKKQILEFLLREMKTSQGSDKQINKKQEFLTPGKYYRPAGYTDGRSSIELALNRKNKPEPIENQGSEHQNSIKYIGFLKRISEKISEKIHQRFYSKFAKGSPITGAEDADAIIYGYVDQEDQNKPNNNDDLNNKLQEIKNTTPIPSEVLDKVYRNVNISESDWSKFDRSVATKAAKLQASIS